MFLLFVYNFVCHVLLVFIVSSVCPVCSLCFLVCVEFCVQWSIGTNFGLGGGGQDESEKNNYHY